MKMSSSQRKHLRLVDDKKPGDIEFNNIEDYIFDFMVKSSVPRTIIGSELNKGKLEVSTTSFESGDKMDDMTKMILDKMDRDAREREERYHKDAQEREQRYRQEMLEQDRRFRQEAKDREERIIAAIEGTKKDIMGNISEIKEDTRSSKNAVIGLAVTTIIGVAAMAITLFLALKK